MTRFAPRAFRRLASVFVCLSASIAPVAAGAEPAFVHVGKIWQDGTAATFERIQAPGGGIDVQRVVGLAA